MQSPDKKSVFYVIAGEASGDAIGAGLLQELRATYGEALALHGVGGPRMIAAGFTSLFDYSEIAVMGFAEVVRHIPRIKKRMAQTVDDIVRTQPDALITIDAPGFNKRVVQQVRQRMGAAAPLFVHMVAPTVWAYKPKRAKTFAKLFDHLLVILPFEPPYFTAQGLACDYIGHPSAWEWQHTTPDVEDFKQRHQITKNERLLGVLLGSRIGEIERHWPIFVDTMGQLAGCVANLKTILPVPAHLRAWVEGRLHQWPTPVVLIDPVTEKHAAFASMEAALSKSGTVSLELALAGVAQVVTYKVSAASAWLVKRMLRIPYVSLVNILADKKVLPEFLQTECRAEILVPALQELLSGNARAQQLAEAKEALEKLNAPHQQSPARNAVDVIRRRLATR